MSKINMINRTIYCLDNLPVLEGINSQTVDLIYLDPPFNKNDTFITKQNSKIAEIKKFFLQQQRRFPEVDFNKIFKNDASSFKDIWNKNDVQDGYYVFLAKHNSHLVAYLDSIDNSTKPGTFYYLLFMSIRLLEMHRILKDTGSLYLHCDPTMSHYLKGVLDKIFGHKNFMNEITWHYRRWPGTSSCFQRMHDVILFYRKGDGGHCIFNTQYQKYANESYIEDTKRGFVDGKLVRLKDEQGKSIKREKKNIGVPMHDVWSDINFIAPTASERTGYPTQKPLRLLRRIIKASSNEGDLVLDPFCGCATTCIAAEQLKRKWIGIDWNVQAYYMVYWRAYKDNLLGTEHNRTLFSEGGLKLSKDLPHRTDLTPEEQEDIKTREGWKDWKDWKEQVKRVKMTLGEKKVAKELLYEEQRGLCKGCDAYLRAVDLTIDHITPRAEEGEDNIDNLQLLCFRCNNWKGTGSMVSLTEKLYKESIISKEMYEAKKEIYRP